jgi:flagellar biosynthesis GTPase FlhF
MSDPRLAAICGKTYKEQAVWFLNCFWNEYGEKDAELFWQYVQKNAELDLEYHENGSGLDEMKAHVFLEKFDETLTVRDMRDKLRSTGAIGQTERPKTVPLTHYLLYKYNADWRVLVDESRQGSNKEEMAKAEKLVAEVQAAFRDSEEKAALARKAYNEAQAAEASAIRSEQAAKEREASANASAAQAKEQEAKAKADAAVAKEAEQAAVAAQQELEAALAEVKAQEDAYNAKKADLERKSEEGGVVSRLVTILIIFFSQY